MRLLLLLLLLPAAWSQETTRFPGIDAADAQFGPEAESATPQHWFTKRYVLGEGVHIAAGIFDIHETLSHQGRCGLEGNNGFPEKVTGKELGFELVVEVGATIGARWLLAHGDPPRWARVASFGGTGYGTYNHLRGGIEWYSRCH